MRRLKKIQFSWIELRSSGVFPPRMISIVQVILKVTHYQKNMNTRIVFLYITINCFPVIKSHCKSAKFNLITIAIKHPLQPLDMAYFAIVKNTAGGWIKGSMGARIFDCVPHGWTNLDIQQGDFGNNIRD